MTPALSAPPAARNPARVLVILILAASLTACASARRATVQVPQQSSPASPTRRTIFIPVMDGYEKNVASAFAAADVPVEIVTDKAKADLQVKPTFSKSDSSIGAVLYKKQTGHEPFSYLDVVEVETNRTLLSYPFLWTDYEVSRIRDGQEFARELKNKLVPKAQRNAKQ
jgi:hypothetical protein